MVLLELFWSFVKIGFTSFGGMSMIPLISSEMLAHGWMTNAELSDIVAIAEMTPGPLGINSATFAGLRAAGVPGALAATLGVMTPTLTLCLLAAIFFERFKSSHRMEQIMVGVRPACMGTLCGVGVSLALTNYLRNAAVSYTAAAIGLLDLFLLLKCKLTIPKVLLISAALGILCFGVLHLP